MKTLCGRTPEENSTRLSVPMAPHSHAETFLRSKRHVSGQAEPNLLALNGVHGGKFYLQTDEEWQSLRKAVARDHFEGNRNFLVEHKTPVFKLFFDIDFAHLKLGMQYVLKTLLPIILAGVAAALDPDIVYQDVIVTASPPKPKGELTKTGIHLHWQSMAVKDQVSSSHRVQPAVDSITAMAIRASVLHSLSSLPDEGLQFDDVVDKSVLGKNGIRMLFSSKSAPCSLCQTANRKVAKDHPCQAGGKESFWRCSCPGCLQARAAMQVCLANIAHMQK